MKFLKCKCGQDVLLDIDSYEELKGRLVWCNAKAVFVSVNNRPVPISNAILTPLSKVFLTSEFRWDHEDGNKHNNQRSNLRPATNSENCANSKKRSTNTSGFKGVSWSSTSKKWMAVIYKDYKQYYLGLFDSRVDAALAYDEAATRLFGEFARLNFPSGILIEV